MIIGVTGLNASGKGEFCKYLAKKGFIAYSLSDIIRQELRFECKEPTRENLIAKGNELRQKHGSAALAEMTLKKFMEGTDYVIDSIRNPEEVKVLKKNKSFKLVYVEAAPIEERFERAKKRLREGETIDFNKFKEEEEKELKNSDSKSQQLLACQELADYTIKNDSTIEKFHEKINELLEGLQ
jgi:dephospho-CoA kinase